MSSERIIIGFPYGNIDQEKDCTVTDVAKAFSEYSFGGDDSTIDISYADIYAAYYTYENYSGDAFVLYRDTRDEKWYEVNGSHCSCYGLEDQWRPELVSTAAIKGRMFDIDGGWGLTWGDREPTKLEQRFKDTVDAALAGVEQRVSDQEAQS